MSSSEAPKESASQSNEPQKDTPPGEVTPEAAEASTEEEVPKTATQQLVEDIKLMTDLASTLPTFWSIDNVVEESNNPTGDYRSGGTNTILVELSKGFEDEKKGHSVERDKKKLLDFEHKLMLPLVGIKLKVEIVD